MLSALIGTEHSYPALLLAEQPADQRFVHPGPLVTFSFPYHYGCRLYLSPSHLRLGDRHLMEAVDNTRRLLALGTARPFGRLKLSIHPPPS